MGFTEFTFFVTNMALLAAGLFLWLERDNVNPKWKTALSVSGMVCFIAAVHYYYMRDPNVSTDVVAIRYIDWLITVPLQMVEFYIVLAAVTAVSVGVLHRLLGFSVLISSALSSFNKTRVKNSNFMDYYLNEQLNINPPSGFMDFYEPVLLETN